SFQRLNLCAVGTAGADGEFSIGLNFDVQLFHIIEIKKALHNLADVGLRHIRDRLWQTRLRKIGFIRWHNSIEFGIGKQFWPEVRCNPCR
ncbi:MAG: hypothetical protein JWM68_2568, partial [Verrucomicrobiales bacterium]|nr:hypothetical protein [Verrucomicrobiales bacterium]